MSAAKIAGANTPFLYFVNPTNASIVMEYIRGTSVKNCINTQYCIEMGKRAAAIHSGGIVHGDLTTSNFLISTDGLVLLDFGLAHFSTRIEDMATDVRLAKEVLKSVHISVSGAYEAFVEGYESMIDKKVARRVLKTVAEIERRGRYARMD
jgi:TP53 regulating kinase-like protein